MSIWCAAWTGTAGAETVTLCGGSGALFGENATAVEPLFQPDLGPAVTTLVTVDLSVQHEWVGDLWVFLNHADKNVELLQLPGSPASVYGCGGDDVEATFRDDAGAPAEDACALTPPAISGVFQPVGQLGDFAGDDPSGYWTLFITDLGADDCGVLPVDGVCVHVTYAADCNENGVPDAGDIAGGNSGDDNGNGVPDECEVPGDCDADGDVDLSDYVCFTSCRTGPGQGVPPGCAAFDFDGDQDVDLLDWRMFQLVFNPS